MADEKRNDDSSCSWSREQDKAFENAIANYGENCLDQWEKIAEAVPGKSLQEIKEHYELLIDDITEIEAGRVPLPLYSSSSGGSSNLISEGNSRKGQQLGNFDGELNNGSKGSRADQERRKGIAWTEEEHKLFLLGLDKYGKGDWRSISRNFVVTRTPTQVASHAQKYFIRLNTMNKERRRSSIHDITSVNNVDATQGPITGQTNGTANGPTGKQNNLPDQTSPPVPSVGIYGTPTMGQAVGSLVPAVGTPVSLPPPAHLVYGVKPPINGPMVQGAPMNADSMKYPVTHRSCYLDNS